MCFNNMRSMDIKIWISGILVLFIILKHVSHSSLGCNTKAGAGGSLLAFRLELHPWNCKLQRTKHDRTLKSKNTAVGHARPHWYGHGMCWPQWEMGLHFPWGGWLTRKCGVKPSGFVEGHKRKQRLLTGPDSVRSRPTFSYYFKNIFFISYHVSLFCWFWPISFQEPLLSSWCPSEHRPWAPAKAQFALWGELV